MSEKCILCFDNKTANTFCKPCNALFCDDCVDTHINLFDAEHTIINYQLYLEQNESKIHERKSTMKTITVGLRERLVEANIEVDNQHAEIISLINSKKEELHQQIDAFYDAKIEEISGELNSARITLESMLTDLSLQELAKYFSPEDCEKMLFLEEISPQISKDLEASLRNELGYNLEIYPSGKQLPLYSFKSNSSLLFQYDILSEEEATMNIKNFECKTYAGWCLAESNIIYTGGWKQGYSSYEAFEINTRKWSIEHLPNLLTPRHQHAAIYLSGTVYIFGGASQKGLTRTCEKWRKTTASWENLSQLKSPKTQMSVCVVGTHIYISSDSEIERYEPDSDTFTILPIIFESKLLSVIVAMEESILLFRGGEVSHLEITPSPIIFRTATIEVVDLWSSTSPILKSNKIYFIMDNTRIVYCYDIIEKTLELLADLNHPDDSISLFK